MSWRAKIWLTAACGLVLAQAAGSLLLPQKFALTALSDIIQFLLLLSGTLALFPNVLCSHGRTRLFWGLMSCGVVFWLLYQSLWTYFEVVLRLDVPNPFVGDIVLFLHLVPMMAALALQPHFEHDERTARLGSLDFALLLVWWLYLYLFAVIPWQYVQSNEVIYEHNLNVLYMTEKIVFLGALALGWWRSHASWKFVYAQWFGASVTYALSSYVANWAIERNAYYSGSLYDVPLVVSIAWITGIGLLTRGRSQKQWPDPQAGAYGVSVARVGMVAVCSMPLLAVWSVLASSAPPRIRSFRLVLTLGSMLGMGAMVFLRQHLLDLELVGLLRSSQESFESLQRLQQQLVQSEKLASLGLLVGGAAHELNNPLTAMLGYSDLLVTTQLGHEQRLLAEKIGQHVRRAKSLISSLLSFAKQVPRDKTPLDVNALAQTTIKLSLSRLRDRSLEIQTDFAGGLPQVLGDSNQLLHVCLHITENALHGARKAGGILRVRTCQEDDRVVLEFSGDRSSVPERDRGSDPLLHLTPAGEESGLGLNACYGIIQDHQGKIVRHNQPADVETFRIELPIPAKAGLAAASQLSWAGADRPGTDGQAAPANPQPDR